MRRLAVLTVLLLLSLAASAQARVMNGSDAGAGEYPWTVALVFAGAPPVEGQFCGGSLVAADMVVTAAHCTMGSRADEIEVYANDVDLEGTGATHAVASIHIPENAVVDPDDQSLPPRRDVAILRLATPVANAEPIEPVDPADPADDALWGDGADLEVMGWGRWHKTDPHPPYPSVLQHATLDRYSDAYCESLPWVGFEPEDMLCALRAHNTTVWDSCSGDSGGPLTTVGSDPSDPSTGWKLVGSVSYGSPGCDTGDYPGVYARLGAADLHAFVEAFRDGFDEGADPAAQLEQTGGSPVLSGTLRVGEQISCGAGTTSWTATPDAIAPRIRRWEPVDEEYGELVTVAVGPTYTLQSSDAGDRFVCEVHAAKDGVGGYGVARWGLSAPVAAAPKPPDQAPVAPVPPPPPPPLVPTIPVPPEPQPFVPEPRDDAAPRTTRVSKRCVARRCALTIRASDAGVVVSGVQSLDLTLITRYRCTRGRRARTCVRRRELTATRVAPGVFRARTARLPRRSRNTLRVVALDAAGNEEARARLFTFFA